MMRKGPILRRFFFFKRGYSQYLTYVLGFVSLVETTVLSVSLLLGVQVWLSLAVTLAAALPVAYVTAKVGRWDMVGGAKPIESILQFKNDPVAQELMVAVHHLLAKDDPAYAEEFWRKVRSWSA